MSVANNFCDMPLPKYLDLKTVLIYRPHPVQVQATAKHLVFFHVFMVRRIFFLLNSADISSSVLILKNILKMLQKEHLRRCLINIF
jgi:hypothetical protein